MKIRLCSAIKERPIITIVLAISMFFVTPIIQSMITPLAFEIWFRQLLQKPISAVPYAAFSVLFGILVSMYLYSKNKCFDCNKKEEGIRSGFVGSVLGFILGVCPACFSFIGFLLPLSASIFLTHYSPIFNTLSVAIVLFSIFKLGGFKKELSRNDILRETRQRK